MQDRPHSIMTVHYSDHDVRLPRQRSGVGCNCH